MRTEPAPSKPAAHLLRFDAHTPPTLDEARHALTAWAQAPTPLPRPVIIHPGFMMPAFALDGFRRTIAACATDTQGRVISQACHPVLPIRVQGDRLAARAEPLYALGDGKVDVIAHSMGGIVTREAARHLRPRGLRVARLFCLASPHQGAGFLAPYTPHHQARDLSLRSSYLDELNADPSSHDFEIHTFRLHRDRLISAESAHAVGDRHYDWPPLTRWFSTHAQAQWDIRLRAAVIGLLLG
ncbi:MAG: alpha/beta fold hydrolase, partial [Proteobacteria bacterium]|nr:alpha/beta fold hydrolase [Pseudomonadota bacterium]